MLNKKILTKTKNDLLIGSIIILVLFFLTCSPNVESFEMKTEFTALDIGLQLIFWLSFWIWLSEHPEILEKEIEENEENKNNLACRDWHKRIQTEIIAEIEENEEIDENTNEDSFHS